MRFSDQGYYPQNTAFGRPKVLIGEPPGGYLQNFQSKDFGSHRHVGTDSSTPAGSRGNKRYAGPFSLAFSRRRRIATGAHELSARGAGNSMQPIWKDRFLALIQLHYSPICYPICYLNRHCIGLPGPRADRPMGTAMSASTRQVYPHDLRRDLAFD